VGAFVRPLVLFFGAFQRREFYETLLRSGIHLGLVRNLDNPTYTAEPEEFDVVERLPFSAGADAICDVIAGIARGWRLESVLNVDEHTVSLWAEVCGRLGLPAPSTAAATAMRSKTVMRELLTERLGAGTGAAFRVVRGAAEARAAALEIGCPVVVKPSHLTGSFFVRRCATPDAAAAAYAATEQRLPAHCRANRVHDVPAEILVEEFLAGSNHSVDCLVLDGQVWSTPVVDVVTGHDLGGADFHHFARTTASRLGPDQQHRTRLLAEATADALGVRQGCLHVELVYGTGGPRLVEVGARPGVSRGPLLHRAYGIDLMAAWRDVLRGRKPDLELRRRAGAAVVTPFPDRDGRLLAYRGLDRIRALPSTYRLDVWKSPGELVGTRWSGASFPLRVQLWAADPARLAADLDLLREVSSSLFDLAAR
jgi:hypothetical protein